MQKGEVAANGNYLERDELAVRHGVCGDPEQVRIYLTTRHASSHIKARYSPVDLYCTVLSVLQFFSVQVSQPWLRSQKHCSQIQYSWIAWIATFVSFLSMIFSGVQDNNVSRC